MEVNQIELDDQPIDNPVEEEQEPSSKKLFEEFENEIDFEDPNLEMPVCVYCLNPFSIRNQKTPYILPCQNHNSCK